MNKYKERPQCVLHVMHMSETKKFNALGIIGIIGAILMIAGVFVSWLDVSMSGLGQTFTESYSGIDIYSGNIISNLDIGFDDITSYYYAPIVALACGIISIIATIVSTVYCKGNVGKVMGAIALILAIVALILGFLYYGDVEKYQFSESFLGISASLTIGYGLWIVIAGAIITVIGGIIDIAKKTD